MLLVLSEPSSVKDLELAIQNEAEMVRAYSAWSLGQIGGKTPVKETCASAVNSADWNAPKGLRERAEQILEQALLEEKSAWVIEEIRAALSCF